MEKALSNLGLSAAAFIGLMVLIFPVMAIEAWVLRDIWLLTMTPALNLPCSLSIPQVMGILLMVGGVRAALFTSQRSKEEEKWWLILVRSWGGLLIAWFFAFALNRTMF